MSGRLDISEKTCFTPSIWMSRHDPIGCHLHPPHVLGDHLWHVISQQRWLIKSIAKKLIQRDHEPWLKATKWVAKYGETLVCFFDWKAEVTLCQDFSRCLDTPLIDGFLLSYKNLSSWVCCSTGSGTWSDSMQETEAWFFPDECPQHQSCHIFKFKHYLEATH
jgi:hypothetical protein